MRHWSHRGKEPRNERIIRKNKQTSNITPKQAALESLNKTYSLACNYYSNKFSDKFRNLEILSKKIT